MDYNLVMSIAWICECIANRCPSCVVYDTLDAIVMHKHIKMWQSECFDIHMLTTLAISSTYTTAVRTTRNIFVWSGLVWFGLVLLVWFDLVWFAVVKFEGIGLYQIKFCVSRKRDGRLHKQVKVSIRKRSQRVPTCKFSYADERQSAYVSTVRRQPNDTNHISSNKVICKGISIECNSRKPMRGLAHCYKCNAYTSHSYWLPLHCQSIWHSNCHATYRWLARCMSEPSLIKSTQMDASLV